MLAAAATGALALGAAACGSNDSSSGGGSDKLSGKIAIDGSSTVYPFAQAAAEQFQADHPKVKITVGESGTGGGFEKFCAGETDISDASRSIDPAKEAPVCKKKGVSYGEVQIANDGIAIVTNKALKIDCLTTAQLKTLWNSKSTAKSYKALGAGMPDAKVSLYGPGTDSGTFDFFTETINGTKGDTRKDYQPTEDDNVTVQGVSGDKNGLGYFGFSYYEANQDKLNLVGVNAGAGCKKPSKDDIQNGTYKPLARPLFMYPSSKSIARPEVKAFLQFVLDNYKTISENSQIVPLTDAQATKARAELASAEK
jgi:phosphate transport system substrate-binding protein